MKSIYRILDADHRILYTGTERGSWMTLEEARRLVDYSRGEMIYEYSDDFMYPLWEVF